MPTRTRGMLRDVTTESQKSSMDPTPSSDQVPRIKKDMKKTRPQNAVTSSKVRDAKPLDTKVTNSINATDSIRYFLMKAEPESRIEDGTDVKFSIDDLKAVGTEPWDGVRNAEASKTMRERMKIGDKAFFYHSNTKTPGIAGIVTICREGYPDSSAWTEGHPYYDPKTVQEKPKWFRVDVAYERHMKRFISLRELKEGNFPELQNMQLLRRPQLSVQQVSQAEWDLVLTLEEREPPEFSSNKKPKTKHEEADSTTIADNEQKEEQTDKEVMDEIAYTHGA